MSASAAVPAVPAAARDSSPLGEVSPPPRTSPAGEIFEIEGVELTSVAAVVTGDLSADDVAAAVRRIADRERGNRWWLGDLLAFGDRTHGVTYREFADRTGLDVDTLYNRCAVAKAVPPSVRLPEDELPWGRHRAVAALGDPDAQGKWLALAADEDWTEGRLRHEIQAEGERQAGSGGRGTFAGKDGEEFADPLAGRPPCSHCGGCGLEPEGAA